ncbi:MAG: hypothetical protein QOG72_2465 [Sphingomonadales bacterium]|jgi:hypothetical protein|nr:hypothetical protein [Sphingomonadales bacterium]
MAAREEIYRPQVAPGGSTAFGGAPAEAFGAGVGRSLEQAGGQLHQAGLTRLRIDQQHEEEAEFTRASKGAGEVLLDIERKRIEMEENPAAGAAGHAAGFETYGRHLTQEYVGTITDRRVRDRVEEHLNGAVDRLILRAETFEAAARGEQRWQDQVDADNFSLGRINLNPGRQTLVEEMATVDDRLAALPGSDEKKRQYRARIAAAASRAVLDGLPPEEAKRELESGYYTGWLGDAVGNVRERIDARLERDQARARQAVKGEQAEFRARAENLIEDVNSGVEVDPASIDEARRRAVAIGGPEFEKLARDLEVTGGKARVTDKYGASDEGELRAAQRAIAAKDGWEQDRSLKAEYDQLGTMIERWRGRAEKDKLGLFIQNGGGRGLPEFDLADPRAMSRWFAAGDGAAERYGGPPTHMTAEIAARYHEEFESGSAGDKAAMIETMTAYGNARGKQLLRQVAPAKAEYAALADLASMRNRSAGMGLVREALGGWDLIRANPKLAGGDGATEQMRADAEREFGEATRMMDGVTLEGINEAARGIYAARAARRGKSSYDRPLWLEAYRAAFGAAGDGTGGIGEARDGSKMGLPRGMSQGDVDLVLARSDEEAIMGAAFGGRDVPLWGGKRMSAAEFKKLRPVMWRDGLYMFQSGSGFVASAKHPGDNFILDIRQLGRLTHGRAGPAPTPRAAPSKPVRSAYELVTPFDDGRPSARSAYEGLPDE